MTRAERALREPTFSEMEAGRHLIRNGRAWLTLTDEDVERGARAVVLDPQYRAEIGRSALKHAMEVGDPVLYAAISDEWTDLDQWADVGCARNQQGDLMAQAEIDVFEHADLHQAIAEILASGGPVEDELDAATEVMDLLVQRQIIPSPMGYGPE